MKTIYHCYSITSRARCGVDTSNAQIRAAKGRIDLVFVFVKVVLLEVLTVLLAYGFHSHGSVEALYCEGATREMKKEEKLCVSGVGRKDTSTLSESVRIWQDQLRQSWILVRNNVFLRFPFLTYQAAAYAPIIETTTGIR